MFALNATLLPTLSHGAAGTGPVERLLDFLAYFFATVGHFFTRLFDIHFTLGLLALVVLLIVAFPLTYYFLLIFLPVFVTEEIINGHYLNAGIGGSIWIVVMVFYYRDWRRRPGRIPGARAPTAPRG